jgi:hypothetical protein
MNHGNGDTEFRKLLHHDSTQGDVEALRGKWQHSITLVQEAGDVPRVGNGTTCQNCFTFALGHSEWVGSKEMKGLVASIVPKAEDAVIDGDLVVYFHDDDSVAHAGVVHGELVRSKWRAKGRSGTMAFGRFPLAMARQCGTTRPMRRNRRCNGRVVSQFA